MMTFLVSSLLVAAAAQAQTSRNCADSNAEVSACPENYLPQAVAPSAGGKQSVVNALAGVDQAVKDEEAAFRELARLKLAANGDQRDGAYVRQLQVVQSATKAKYDLANDAIRLAVVVYNLTPPAADFTGDPRAAVGTTVKPWLPRYSEREIFDSAQGRFRRRTDAELKAEAAANGSVGAGGNVAGAKTWRQGEISIFGQSFTNPDDLALAIYHETSHWVDIAAKPGGFKQSDPPAVSFQTERDAYARSARLARQLGSNPAQMLALAAQFDMQARQSEGKSWEWVIAHHGNWLGIDRKGPLAMVPAEPEAASDGEEILQQKMTELKRQVKENKEYLEHLQKERLEEAARNEELSRLERKKRAFREEMDAEAAACGYRIRYDSDNETMLGFGDRAGGFILGRHQVPFDFGDLKVVFLMTRTCEEIESHPNQPPPTACNGAAALLHERVGRGDFAPKLAYLTATLGFTYSDRSDCIKNLLANADRISDAGSFDLAATTYQKQLSKRLAQESKRDRERERREREDDHGGGSAPPQGGRDRDCTRNGDPFGCQPR